MDATLPGIPLAGHWSLFLVAMDTMHTELATYQTTSDPAVFSRENLRHWPERIAQSVSIGLYAHTACVCVCGVFVAASEIKEELKAFRMLQLLPKAAIHHNLCNQITHVGKFPRTNTAYHVAVPSPKSHCLLFFNDSLTVCE